MNAVILFNAESSSHWSEVNKKALFIHTCGKNIHAMLQLEAAYSLSSVMVGKWQLWKSKT